eukprot:1942177-Rhodomonas_salina.1
MRTTAVVEGGFLKACSSQAWLQYDHFRTGHRTGNVQHDRGGAACFELSRGAALRWGGVTA